MHAQVQLTTRSFAPTENVECSTAWIVVRERRARDGDAFSGEGRPRRSVFEMELQTKKGGLASLF